MGRVERKRGGEKGPSPERVLELVQEARIVAEQFGCPVVVNAPGKNGTASILIGKTPELTALTPDQKHVIFPPGEEAQVFPAETVTTPVVDGKSAVVDSEIPAVTISTELGGKKDKKRKPHKPVSTHNLQGFTGFWRGTYYEDGVSRPRNGNKGKREHR